MGAETGEATNPGVRGAIRPEAHNTPTHTAILAYEDEIRRLRLELRITREQLQTTIAALETTNEELSTSNEEYQSLNEELAVSKEELQAINYELTTVNGELASRVHELGRVNSDLKNLLESTQIATIFLDTDLRVMNFTPAAVDIFHIRETNVGRPIGHIKSRVLYNELQDDARQVLRTLDTIEREVDDPAALVGYIVRVLPYRNIDNLIAGVVLTFTDVSELKQAEAALRASTERLRLVTEHIPQFVWTALDGGQWTWTSRQWSEYTGQAEADSHGLGWLACVHPDDRPATKAAWEAASATGRLDIEHRVRSAAGVYRWVHARAAPLARGGADNDHVEWFGTSTDVHERRELRDQQAVMVSELQHRTRNLLAVVRSLADKTMNGSATPGDFRDRFRDRLSALSRVQGLLSRKPESARVTFETLLRAELAAHGATDAAGRGPQVTLDGPTGAELRSGTVQTFALALHELATNAVKYGALSTPTGRLSVRWRLEKGTEHTRLRVEWRETGVALPEGTESTRPLGYGRELIERALPYQLGAETEFRFGPDGIRCTIAVPVPDS